MFDGPARTLSCKLRGQARTLALYRLATCLLHEPERERQEQPPNCDADRSLRPNGTLSVAEAVERMPPASPATMQQQDFVHSQQDDCLCGTICNKHVHGSQQQAIHTDYGGQQWFSAAEPSKNKAGRAEIVMGALQSCRQLLSVGGRVGCSLCTDVTIAAAEVMATRSAVTSVLK